MRVILLICLVAAAAAAQMPKIEPGVSLELAKWRAVQYSNISYKLNLTLEKMSPVLKGSIEIHVTQAAYACTEPNCPEMAIVLDWRKIPGHEKDSTISNVTINGKSAKSIWSRLELQIGRAGPPRPATQTTEKPPVQNDSVGYVEDNEHLIFEDGVVAGENVIKLDFTSPILTSGSAITRYIDKEDGSEYIYSLFVPSDASTAFPCFDQPDLKARFSLTLKTPDDWIAVTNTSAIRWVNKEVTGPPGNARVVADDHINTFEARETQPISTYVFAFAAGPFKEFTDAGVSGRNASVNERAPASTTTVGNSGGTLPNGRVSARGIYVRASQAKKFEPHFKEVARLRDESIKYLESYFDYKFPFPKLDLVLIPEFPFGGMEHAGAIFLREDRIIFPAEPTKGDYLARANLIFHEAAHQWFGDTVTMRWFDDLWLKEGFAEFMAYKTLEKVMPDANAWKVFYERNKQAAYLTDSTRGTTPIYQPISNLSAAKSAYGNIVYRKAPSFLRQAEFYLGEDKFQTAVRAFLKKHEFGNAGWEDLVGEFEDVGWRGDFRAANAQNISKEAEDYLRVDFRKSLQRWVTQRGMPRIQATSSILRVWEPYVRGKVIDPAHFSGYRSQRNVLDEDRSTWTQKFKVLGVFPNNVRKVVEVSLFDDEGSIDGRSPLFAFTNGDKNEVVRPDFVFLNYQDYGYGIFLLDDKSRDYVLKHIGEEKDPFLRSMMWGALWDSVREAELDPREYVELAIKNVQSANFSSSRRGTSSTQEQAKACTLNCGETDETIIQSLLGRVSTALNYYVSDTQRAALAPKFEEMLLDRLQHAPTAGQRITFYRAYVANASTPKGRQVLKQMLTQAAERRSGMPLRTKDKFDIVTRLIILNDPEAPKLLADLEKTETIDDAKRYAYAARAAFGTAENKAKFFSDFTANKDISESWIETAVIPFNSLRHSDLTQSYLERALKELPNLKRTRKIFFINNWLAAWIAGQRDQKALDIVNKFLTDNPNLDNDLRLKVLENIDLIERAVRIRNKYR